MNYLGLNVYGVANVDIQRCFHEKLTQTKHFGSMIDQIVSSLVFGRLEEQFHPYFVEFGDKTLRNLSYSYMPYSSSGFGNLILKNSSFNEQYSVTLREKTIGEKNSKKLILVHPQISMGEKDYTIQVEPGSTVSVTWICSEEI